MYIFLVALIAVFQTMNAKTTDERRLRTELKWAREALAIAEMQEESMSFHGIAEARKECIKLPYRHMAEWQAEDIEEHIERIEQDLEHAQAGGWE